MTDSRVEIAHDEVAHAFVAYEAGTRAGALHYRVADGVWETYSTVVAPEFEGRGIGSALCRAAVAAAIADDVGIDATCWFVAGWLSRHPDIELPSPRTRDVLANRAYWDERAPEWVSAGERQWESEPNWGVFGVPESQLRLLPESADGLRTLELGCGTGFVSSWLGRRGAEAFGIDNSSAQLATARRLSSQHGVPIGLVHGDAERLPFAHASFDMVVTEYGAVTWCDPRRWVPEAARVLRPGGRLTVFGGSPWVVVATPASGAPAEPVLHRDYFGLNRTDWTDAEIDPGGIQFDLTVSGWFELFVATGFRVERFLEVSAPADAADTPYVTADWASRFPAEQAWVLTRS